MRDPWDALQLGLCHTCWQNQGGRADPNNCWDCVGPHTLEMCLRMGQVIVLTQAPAQEGLTGPAGEVAAADKHTDMAHVNRNCSWPSTSENAASEMAE